MPKYNAIMLTTIGNAGTLEKIKRGEKVTIYPCTNLPNDGRDSNGKVRYFAVNRRGIETLVYADEFKYITGE